MTVSLSLRNHASIPVATRERVRKIAEECGYHPDPVIGKLMQQLRIRGRNRASVSICVLVQPRQKKAFTYSDYIVSGAQAAAESLGYFFDKIELDLAQPRVGRLQRLLRNRGIEAVMLTPMMPPANLSGLLDWQDFSVVSTSTSVLGPLTHRVLPDQFGNAFRLCEALRARGFVRYGLVTGRDQAERTGHRVDAAVQWHNRANGVYDLPTLLCEHVPPKPQLVRSWMKRHKPDVIISDSNGYLEMFCESMPDLREFPLVATSVLDKTSRFAGILENPSTVGAAAVELLSSLFQRGERGLPVEPRVTLIAGQYWEPENAPRSATT